MSGALTLVAPLAGWAAPLAETPDPVFAEKMLGDGIAIDPTLGELRAPCDGVVIGLHDSLHAVTIRAMNGAEVLLHVGLETVKCCGEGFEAVVEIGHEAHAGDLLLRFDLESLARNAASLMSPVVVVNGHAFAVEGAVTGREVAFGEPIMSVRPLAAETVASEAAASETRRRKVRVGLPHGLHARPAALVAHEAGKFAAEIALEIGGRRANARSPVAVMALAVRAGDEVDIVAVGSDAVAALRALADAMADGRPVAPPPPVEPVAATAPSPGSPLAVLVGVPAAPGLAIGAAVRLIEPEPPIKTEADSPAAERAALDAALQAVRIALAGRVASESAQSREIAEAHLAFLADPELEREADAAIAAGASAGVAWAGAIGGYVDQLRAAGDARMLERAADLADLQRQVLLQLSGETAPPVALPDNAIVLADDILPSQLMELDPKRVAGLAISRGGPTSHVAILAAANEHPGGGGAGAARARDRGRRARHPRRRRGPAAGGAQVGRDRRRADPPFRAAPETRPRRSRRAGALPHGGRDAHRGVRQSGRGRGGGRGGRERRRGLRPPAHRVPVHGPRRAAGRGRSSSRPIRPSPTRWRAGR